MFDCHAEPVLPAYSSTVHSLSSAGCNCDVGVMATTLRLTIGLQLAMQACFNTGRPAVNVPRGTQMTEVSLKPEGGCY
jgi:hypothetical protein